MCFYFYRETVCFIVGSFGVVPLWYEKKERIGIFCFCSLCPHNSLLSFHFIHCSVHTIAYNLVPLLFMIPLGIMIGLTVRMGHVIAYDVKRAKLLAGWCMLFTTILGAVVATLLYQFRVEIASMFTNDKEVIQGCKDIWPKLCYYIFILYIFGINSAILRALGMQWHLAAVIFVCLWIGTLPTIATFAIHRNGGIDAVWNTLPVFYTIMQVLLAWCYLSADWHLISKKVREHALETVAEVETMPATEETHLLKGKA